MGSDFGRYDLVIVGGTAAAVSVGISSKRSDIERVRLVVPSGEIVFPELVAENQLDVGYGETIQSIDAGPGDALTVTTNLHRYLTTGCLVARRDPNPEWTPPIPIPESPHIRVDQLSSELNDRDVLIVGSSDHAVELLAIGAARGGRMVLAGAGMDPGKLSPAGEHMLRRLERERRATVLYRSTPDQLSLIDNEPVAHFNDRRTPDLVFDEVVFASTRRRPPIDQLGITEAALATGKVVFLGEPDEDPTLPIAPGWQVGNRVAETCFPDRSVAPPRSPVTQRASHSGAIDELRAQHYNATITRFDPTHSDLWILRVRPDGGDANYTPGQYATLGLGFWEARIDDAVDPDLDTKWAKMVRRSYSISHRIFDDHGYLADPNESDELEFYIVLVRPYDGHVPGLTPRLALKKPGDRIHLGAKVAGRYTLGSITDPDAPLLFFSTGTGEAPHNAMVTELLRKGHTGPIVSAVTVRRWVDLAYLEKHRRLADRFPNYHYVPMPTREDDVPKRYLQNLVTDGDLDELLGDDFSPDRAHAFLCGNPAMIGLPEGADATFPTPAGVVELLAKRGFTLDRRGKPGNIHYEEYW